MSKEGSFMRMKKRRAKVINFDDAVIDRLIHKMWDWINPTEEELEGHRRDTRFDLMRGKTPDEILQHHREWLDSMNGHE